MTTPSIINMNHTTGQSELEQQAAPYSKERHIAQLERSIASNGEWIEYFGKSKNTLAAARLNKFVAQLQAELASLTAPAELPDSFETPGSDPDADPVGYMRTGY